MESSALQFARFPEAVWPATYQLNKENARTISLFFASFAPSLAACAHLRNLRNNFDLTLLNFSDHLRHRATPVSHVITHYIFMSNFKCTMIKNPGFYSCKSTIVTVQLLQLDTGSNSQQTTQSNITLV